MTRLTQEDIAALAAVQEYITKHQGYEITIRELAKKVMLGESKLRKTFKQLYGSGIREYINITRMEKAKLLLESTNYSISRIALECGYKRINSFTKSFTKRFKISPVTWRKTLNDLKGSI